MYCYFENPLKTIFKVRKLFKFPKLKFRLGFNLWNRPFIWVSPDKIMFVSRDVGWKDKWYTPRYEEPPYVWIKIYSFEIILWLEQDPDYWEQILWYLYYYDTISYGRLSEPNIQKAKESWPWKTYKTEESTWNDKYLK